MMVFYKVNVEIEHYRKAGEYTYDLKPTVFTVVQNLTCVEEWKEPSKLTFTLPNNFQFLVGEGTYREREITIDNSFFSEGDKIIYKRGYDNNLETRFTGYINNISSTSPITITALDYLYIYNREIIEETSFQLITDKKIIQKGIMNPEIALNFDFPEKTYTELTAGTSKKLITRILSQENNFNYYVDENNTFVVEPLYKRNNDNILTITKDMIVENSSSFTKPTTENIQIRLYVVYTDSKQPNEYVVYPKTQRTTFTRIFEEVVKDINRAEAEEKAKDKYDTTVTTGLSGNFTLFGEPILRQSEPLKVTLEEHTYDAVVERVTETIDIGIRQQIQLKQGGII